MIRTIEQLSSIFKRSVNIKQTLGVRAAAGYLRNRDIPLQAALLNLGFKIRFPMVR